MSDRIFDIPLPDGGINSDTSATQLDDNESPELYNVIVTEPGQIRPRKGWRRRMQFPQQGISGLAAVSAWPVGVVRHENAAIFTFRNTDQSVGGNRYVSTYHLTGDTASLPVDANGVAYTRGTTAINSATPAYLSLLYRPTSATSGTVSVAKVSTRVPSVSYEGSCFFVREDGTDTSVYAWNGDAEKEISISALIGDPSKPDFKTDTSAQLVNGTFSEAPKYNGVTVSVKGWYLTWTGLGDADKRINWRIKEHTSGSTAFVLEKQYGLGEGEAWPLNKDNPTQVPSSLTGALLSTMPKLRTVPARAGVLAVYQDRLWTGRGQIDTTQYPTMPGYYANGIFFSEVGVPERFRGDNFVIIDEEFDEAITAFGHAGGRLVIFKRTKMYVLNGTEPETYSAQLVSGSIGCVDAHSVCQWKDQCIFVSEEGVYSFDGSELRDLSQPRTGHGIRALIQPLLRRDDMTRNQFHHRLVSCEVVGDYLLLSIQDTRQASTPQDMFMLHLPSGAWVKWGNSAWPMAFYLFYRSDGPYMREVHGVARTTASGLKTATAFTAALDNIVAPESPMSLADRFDNVPQFLSPTPNGSPTLPVTDLIGGYLP